MDREHVRYFFEAVVLVSPRSNITTIGRYADALHLNSAIVVVRKMKFAIWPQLVNEALRFVNADAYGAR